jgi:hypothetical protein
VIPEKSCASPEACPGLEELCHTIGDPIARNDTEAFLKVVAAGSGATFGIDEKQPEKSKEILEKKGGPRSAFGFPANGSVKVTLTQDCTHAAVPSSLGIEVGASGLVLVDGNQITLPGQVDEAPVKMRGVIADSRGANASSDGRPERIARQHQRGSSRRERLAPFFDDGVYSRSACTESRWAMPAKDDTPADGVIRGFGKVDGRMVAPPPTASSRAAASAKPAKKRCRACARCRSPVVGPSFGSSTPEGRASIRAPVATATISACSRAQDTSSASKS